MGTAADALRHVVSEVTPIMKQSGFRKRRNCFNRSTSPGVVQVLSFQMSPHRGFGPALHPATFTINLGVYIDVVARQLGAPSRGPWVNEYDCQCRQRIGSLLPRRGDTWWPLGNATRASAVARDAIQNFGLPWLDDLRTVQAILRRHDHDGEDAVSLLPVSPWIDLARKASNSAP